MSRSKHAEKKTSGKTPLTPCAGANVIYRLTVLGKHQINNFTPDRQKAIKPLNQIRTPPHQPEDDGSNVPAC